MNEVSKHNVKLYMEYDEPEEGVDYVVNSNGAKDPREFDVAAFKKGLKKEINALKVRNPAVGKYYEDFILKRNYVDEALEFKVDNIEDVVKIYPGGPNGPNPEDNREHYSEWFFKNQPHELIYGKGENGQK